MSQFQWIDVPLEVVRAAGAGDMRAHEAIYTSCRRPVYSLIRRLINEPAIAEELFQDTFFEVFRSIRSYSGEGAFGAWVRAIAVSKCLMHLRSPWRRLTLSLDEEPLESASPGALDGAASPHAQMEASAQVEAALARLPPLTRTVVWLHDVEGYTHLEIARALNRTVSFSKSQLARAHMRMRQLLDPAGSQERKAPTAGRRKEADAEDAPGALMISAGSATGGEA